VIRKIANISNFGVFDEFNWDTAVRDKGNNIVTFKKFNIIYGRNYSGKTSLSRIFRSLEKGHLPQKYLNVNFEISCDNNRRITINGLDSHSLDIRVYNEDFVKENLSFLINDEGEIQPFAVLGEKNIEIEKQINEREERLGNEERKIGLKYELKLKKSDFERKKQEREKAENALEEQLRNKANRDIKENTLYGDVRYNIRKIKSDIDIVLKANKSKYKLSESEKEKKIQLLKEEAKESINEKILFYSTFSNLYSASKKLITKEIKPSKIIQELIDNPPLQEWVRTGIPYHKDKRETCAFCGQKLPEDLWDKLDAHFNKESEKLRDFLKEQIEELEKAKINIEQMLPISREQFYSFFQDSFDKLQKDLEKEIIEYNKNIDSLINSLKKREKDIFQPKDLPSTIDNTENIKTILNEIKKLINQHNKKTSSLNDEQKIAKKDLRLYEVYQFLMNIDYEKKIEEINTLKAEEQELEAIYKSINSEIEHIEKEIEDLKSQLKDERRGAEKINEYLNHFFGSGRIKCQAIEKEEIGFKFQIYRNSEIAYNLSEGERSLISLCYFIAKLEEVGSQGRNLIIWIDDPVSSLDNNHIFFAFSLIEEVICRPIKNADGSNSWKYEQLFISTHNLEFLKYIKRLSQPKNDNQYFLLERLNSRSRLKLMPDYLKKYITEFNYLFHQIYLCSQSEDTDQNYELFYNFGNNLRKFLEAYLFYRYPYHTNDKLEKLRKFFGYDTQSVDITNRLTNELSHLEEIFDRSLKPVEIPEIPKLARYVLEKIKEKDLEQYNALLKSIGVEPDI